jgi:hypothetical protein
MKPAGDNNGKKSEKRVRSGPLGQVLPSFFAFFAVLLFLPGVAFAAVEITDVMYDPPGSDTGREWVEVTNKGNASVDISKFKFLEGGVKHGLTLAQGEAVLAPGAKAIFASDPLTFLSEHTGFAGTLFKSSFSLSNTGETLALINTKGEVENSLTYAAPPKPAPAPKTKSASSSKKSTAKTATSTSYAAAAGDSFDATGAKNSSLLPWVMGLGGIMVLGVAAVLLVPPRVPSLKETDLNADEFEIE